MKRFSLFDLEMKTTTATYFVAWCFKKKLVFFFAVNVGGVITMFCFVLLFLFRNPFEMALHFTGKRDEAYI